MYMEKAKGIKQRKHASPPHLARRELKQIDGRMISTSREINQAHQTSSRIGKAIFR